MSIIINLLLFIVILGCIVFIHEFGHFTFAKLTGVYVYEFALGMGPKLFSYKPKNSETVYSIRAVPLGGFCSLAGEDIENDEKEVPKDRLLQSKKAWQRFLIMFMGPGFNFISAFILLFMIGLIWGSPISTPKISDVTKNYPAYEVGLEKGDIVTELNGHKIKTMDDLSLYLTLAPHNKDSKIKVEKESGEVKEYSLLPKKEVTKVKGKEQTTYRYGIELKTEKEYGFISACKYMVVKTGSLFKQMGITVMYLFTGGVKLNQLSGPVGIYSIVGEQAKSGLSSIIYLIAYLSINVGFLNLLPIPAFDGGHILFIIIEKIKGSPVSPELENKIHAIGLYLLLALMLFITVNDVLRLFK
ncbi:MAG: RIP metalloprotease RseP [Bacilli bacterium]|nr:RIP metalloprotease RseP [Bacilli bacterium]